MAIKLASFRVSGVGLRAANSQDTAILDDPDEAVLAQSQAAPSTGMRAGPQTATPTGAQPALSELSPDTVMPAWSPAPTVTESAAQNEAGAFASPARQRPWMRLGVLLPLVAGAFILTFVSLLADSRRSADYAAIDRMIGDAMIHSQRLARAAPFALTGSEEALSQLQDSRDRLARAIAGLDSGETPDGSSLLLGGEVLDLARKADEPWKRMAAATDTLLSQHNLLRSLGVVVKTINDGNRDMLEDAQVVATQKLQFNAPARDVSVAGDLVMLTQRIAKDVNQLVMGNEVNLQAAQSLQQDSATFPDLIDTLRNGNERLRIGPVNDAEARRSLDSLKRNFEKLQGPLKTVLADLEKIKSLKAAQVGLFADSEQIRKDLAMAQDTLRANTSGTSSFVMGAWLMTLLGLICAYGLVRVLIGQSRVRAEEAEQRGQHAQHQEQEAKRTNDQNQAAILRLMNELQEVADGDLTVQATVSEDITGAIADSVNYTVEELRNLVSRINSTADLVNEASSKAQTIAASLQAASDQQSREIRDTGEAVLRMAQQINGVSARAAESVDVARQSVNASQQGARAVQNSIAGMNGIRDHIQETAKRIKRLGESSQEIGEIVELISDITEQTNVLALNAAIQAASAGEAGRGFSVVAEEVQRLAERSAEATRQISALIKGIQSDTQDAVAAMERSTQGVVQGTRLSDDAGRALGDIGRVSGQLADLIESFASATSREAASATTLAQSIQRILMVTEQTSEGTSQTSLSIRQLSELSQELKHSVARFKVS